MKVTVTVTTFVFVGIVWLWGVVVLNQLRVQFDCVYSNSLNICINSLNVC